MDGRGFFSSVVREAGERVNRLLRRQRVPSLSAISVDTVKPGGTDPDERMPFAELGMKQDEYDRVVAILGRRPTGSELAIYSVMWASTAPTSPPRCTCGSSAPRRPVEALLVGMGENAGVVDIGDGWAATFKIESHNHPPHVEPHQGAATGVGGIVRDIMSMGARPVAVMDSLRFGGLDQGDTRRVLPGVVEGISHYGNCLGLPNIGGEVVFDPCYIGNPLVNALCVGLLRKDQIKLATAPGPGNKVVLFGARTGTDGIGGASVLASATFEDESQAKRPAVQVGDPFMEKLLIECCLELYQADVVVGIQDLGAAGVSCATTELAAKGTGGMDVDLNLVPLRDPTLRPEEILMSESQERMMAVVTPGDIDAFLAICAKWDVPATVIGEVTDTGRLVMTWDGEVIVDIPPGTAADDGPIYERPLHEPLGQHDLNLDTPDTLERPADLRATLLQLIASPNLSSREWVTSQYDRYVRGNTVLAQPADAGLLQVSEIMPGAEDTTRGIALATDGNGRYAEARPLRRRAARAVGGLPQRGRHRGDPAGGDQLPQLRLARGPRGHVAVRRGGARSGRRVQDPRGAGDRRQRVVLQPDRLGRDQPDARGRRARRASTTSPSG